MSKILIGSAGLGSPAIEGLRLIHSLKLNAAEIEFVRGIYLDTDKAKKIGKEAEKLDISLSIHAPYYINLASEEKSKIVASKKRLFDSCKIGYYLNANYVVFHPAYYGKMSKEDVYELVKYAVLEIQDALNEEGYSNVKLCPETTGKISQFGNIDELVKLSKETNCGLCVDFAHIYARNLGKIDYDYVCKSIKNIKFLTAHFTGIVFGPKGERHHKETEPERAKELLGYLKKYDINIRIINESPQPVEDALMMKKILEEI
ncbi:TIM barrel protein [Candidatus Woesearchaeota archaeon]|nr:TIM barrel protein [Candidatus Woesearchaeota archaeon]